MPHPVDNHRVADGRPLRQDVETLSTEEISNDQQYTEGVDSATVDGATNLDVSSSNAFRHTLGGDVDYSLINAGEALDGEGVSLLIEQDGSTQYAISWPSSIEWDGGAAPNDPATGETLEVVIRSYDGGQTWLGGETWRA